MKLQLVPLLEYSVVSKALCLFYQSSRYMALSLNQQAVLGRSEKVNVGKP